MFGKTKAPARAAAVVTGGSFHSEENYFNPSPNAAMPRRSCLTLHLEVNTSTTFESSFLIINRIRS